MANPPLYNVITVYMYLTLQSVDLVVNVPSIRTECAILVTDTRLGIISDEDVGFIMISICPSKLIIPRTADVI